MPERLEPELWRARGEGERRELPFKLWEEERALDFIIQNTRAPRLRMEDPRFVKHYGKETISEDEAVVEALKERFKEELRGLSALEQKKWWLSQKRGEVLEIIIAEQGELSNWFGADAMTTRTAEIDDFRNKVDIIIEFFPKEEAAGKGPEHIALAIDASDSAIWLSDKVRINQEKIIGGRPPAHVQYFSSQFTDFVGPINKIIPVIVGLEGRNIQDLVRLQEQSLKGVGAKTANEKLANHSTQRVFIEEILAQLRWYTKLLEQKTAQHSTYTKEDIESLLRIMEGLLKEKKSIPLGALDSDRVRIKIQKIMQ